MNHSDQMRRMRCKDGGLGMSDNFEVTLHSPLTKDDWSKIRDDEHENTRFVTFQTPQGRHVKYINIDRIKSEIRSLYKDSENGVAGGYIRGWDAAIDEVLSVIDENEEVRE